MGSIKIAPSVLSADMANLKGELDKIAGADYVHFDVMDGHFTGNLTFGVDILKAVKRSTDVPVDAHLMVSNPDETVDWYADAGADMITVHYEASTHLHRTLTHLQQRGVKACMGLAGMGDLIATCTSEHSRNRTFGYEFAHGVSLDEYQTRTHMVVEGAVAARSVSELARSLGVDIPLTFAVEQTLYNGVTLDRALEILTDRVPSQEFYGLTD